MHIQNREVILDSDEFKSLTAEEKETYYDMLNEVTFSLNEKTGKEEMFINDTADMFFKDQSTGFMRWYLRTAITLVPILLIYFSYLVLKKKYKIDEEMYQRMIKEIEARKTLPEAASKRKKTKTEVPASVFCYMSTH